MRFSLLLLSLLPSFVWAGNIVWSDRNAAGNKAIRVANFDGSNAHVLFDLGSTADPRGIVVVPDTGKIFYCSRTNPIGIQVANFDGSGAPTNLISGLTGPADLKYLPGSPGMLYFADENGGAIRRVGTNGAGLTTLITTGSPYYLDLDPAGGRIFWGTSGSNLSFGPLAGGPPSGTPYSTGQNMRGVCVDAAGGMLYWCERDARAIRRMPISGGTVQNIYTGLDTPHGLVLDLPAGKLYWADTGTNSGIAFNEKGISRGDLDGLGAAEALVTSANSDQAWDLDLDRRTPAYADWVRRFFRKDATAVLTDPGADPDGDGAKNALEYALGFGPMNKGSVPAGTAMRVAESSVEYPAIQFRRRVGAEAIYRVQVSTNLVTWDDNSTSPGTTVEAGSAVPAEDGMETVIVRSTAPLSGVKKFLRVWVQTP